MAELTKISWTDHTFNPWTGCTKVSPGCANCYAEGWAKRSGIVQWGKGKSRRRTSASNWNMPIKWNREAGENIEDALHDFGADQYVAPPRPRVFCASLADWLDDEVPIEWLVDLLELIHATPHLDWLLLTKRPENWYDRIIRAMIDSRMAKLIEFPIWLYEWKSGTPPANVWIGTTVEDQKRADDRIPELLSIPARVRFLSCEPLLEPVHFSNSFGKLSSREIPDGPNRGWLGLHWVIVGGESGPGFRQFNPDWARSLRDQCRAAGVAFHMKQMGGLRPSSMPAIPADLQIQDFPS